LGCRKSLSGGLEPASLRVWGIAPDAAVTAYLWSWAENQVMAALKAVPLGQAAGQRLLADLGGRIPAVAGRRPEPARNRMVQLHPGFRDCLRPPRNPVFTPFQIVKP
jgi:hypothetical protein